MGSVTVLCSNDTLSTNILNNVSNCIKNDIISLYTICNLTDRMDNFDRAFYEFSKVTEEHSSVEEIIDGEKVKHQITKLNSRAIDFISDVLACCYLDSASVNYINKLRGSLVNFLPGEFCTILKDDYTLEFWHYDELVFSIMPNKMILEYKDENTHISDFIIESIYKQFTIAALLWDVFTYIRGNQKAFDLHDDLETQKKLNEEFMKRNAAISKSDLESNSAETS